jgi:type II secretory pathway pseudopilin PulG
MVLSMRDANGFTLVELTVTIIFLGFVTLGFSSLYVSIENVQRGSSYTEIANRAAQAEVETLRNSNYNQLTAGQNIDFTSSLPTGLPSPSGSVAVTEPQTGLKRVDVTVTYGTSGNRHKVTLSSLIGVIGITQ